ncbi:hypothetical protein MCHI_002221 [Candidatus Magnetoovum chiemensis]|nr:hypothetical protein MCHI_002221 [Candidatus Magnetoovum chiemensis]
MAVNGTASSIAINRRILIEYIINVLIKNSKAPPHSTSNSNYDRFAVIPAKGWNPEIAINAGLSP